MPPAKSGLALAADKTKLERAGNAADDLVLQREHLRPLAVETLRPQMTGGRAVDQLRVDAHVVADAADRAFQQVADTERRGDLAGLVSLSL